MAKFTPQTSCQQSLPQRDNPSYRDMFNSLFSNPIQEKTGLELERIKNTTRECSLPLHSVHTQFSAPSRVAACVRPCTEISYPHSFGNSDPHTRKINSHFLILSSMRAGMGPGAGLNRGPGALSLIVSLTVMRTTAFFNDPFQ